MFKFGYQRTMTGENKEKECKATLKDLKGNIKIRVDERNNPRKTRRKFSKFEGALLIVHI